MLPFPSSYFTVDDDSTVTGKRLNIESKAMYKIFKGRGEFNFLNDHDGFSINGPVLFNFNGFSGKGIQPEMQLMGPEDIDMSVMNHSLTVLVDISKRTLVHHFSEFDALDKHRPLIILQPSKPLHYNTQYAVALVNGVDSTGKVLPASTYLEKLLSENNELSRQEYERGKRFQTTLVPALMQAAPWLNEDGATIQLMFDFQTASRQSVVGLTERVIDEALIQTEQRVWNNDDVRVVRIDEISCQNNDGNMIARILHLEIDVPWFLQDNQKRFTRFDSEKIRQSKSAMGIEKILIVIPCSLMPPNNGQSLQKKVRAIIDYGHGFMGSRGALLQLDFLRTANSEGYILLASDWRGMCRKDLPVLMRTLLATPESLLSVRDNIVQGFANKLHIQHFCRTRLLDFINENGINLLVEKTPTYAFYGVSQGGILGSSYTQLAKTSKLIDRSILVSAGSPFTLLISRSTLFPQYLRLLRLNIRSDRRIRIYLNLFQMVWDSIEIGSIINFDDDDDDGMKTLIHTGLGDPVVTSIGSEFMARAYRSNTILNNPVKVFGIPAAANLETINTLFTEIIYNDEMQSLPKTNLVKLKTHNSVHTCTKKNKVLQEQKVTFINQDKFTDPCKMNKCTLGRSSC